MKLGQGEGGEGEWADPRVMRVGLDQDWNSTRRPVPSETALVDWRDDLRES